MKKLISTLILSVLSLLLLVTTLQAQTAPEDYFVGSWKVKAYGLPDGDAEMIIKFEKKEGKFSGAMVDPATKIVTPFTKIEVANNKLTAYFMAPDQQMEVFLTLERKDDTNVKGSIMDMFDMAGTKAK
jgi:hypothetical protein